MSAAYKARMANNSLIIEDSDEQTHTYVDAGSAAPSSDRHQVQIDTDGVIQLAKHFWRNDPGLADEIVVLFRGSFARGGTYSPFAGGRVDELRVFRKIKA